MSLCNDVAITVFLEDQLPRVADRNRGVLLDLGCGEHPYREIYADLFKKVVVADFDVRSRIDVQLDVCALPFRDESCDVVLLTEVIEHVAESAIALHEISRILKTKGYLFLTWPFMHPIHELPRDYVRYTEFGMQHLLEAAGLRIEALYRRGDVLCFGFGIVEQFAFGVLEFLARMPWIGRTVCVPMKQLLRGCVMTAWRMYLMAVGHTRRFRPLVVGANLKGLVNHLALWTIGYCARIRKMEGS